MNSPEPFDIYLTGLESFLVEVSGFNQSYTGMRMYFYRNSLGKFFTYIKKTYALMTTYLSTNAYSIC